MNAPTGPDGEMGWPSLGLALPEPGGEKPAVLPETQPPFVNRRFPFFRSKPQKRSEEGAGQGCAWGGRHEAVPLLTPKKIPLRVSGFYRVGSRAPRLALTPPGAANFALPCRSPGLTEGVAPSVLRGNRARE